MFLRRLSFTRRLCPLHRFTLSRWNSTQTKKLEYTITYILPDGSEKEVVGRAGQDLMRLAHENDIELEGACEGAMACSTCHLILPSPLYSRLQEPCDEEQDMLDLAFGLTSTSRLGCQVKLGPAFEGLGNVKVRLPKATRNMAVDGYKPKPH